MILARHCRALFTAESRYHELNSCYDNFSLVFGGDVADEVSIYLGDNAVGKSSILEALDTYFNGSEWTRTIGSKQIEAFLAVNKKKMDFFLSENAHAL